MNLCDGLPFKLWCLSCAAILGCAVTWAFLAEHRTAKARAALRQCYDHAATAFSQSEQSAADWNQSRVDFYVCLLRNDIDTRTIPTFADLMPERVSNGFPSDATGANAVEGSLQCPQCPAMQADPKVSNNQALPR